MEGDVEKEDRSHLFHFWEMMAFEGTGWISQSVKNMQ